MAQKIPQRGIENLFSIRKTYYYDITTSSYLEAGTDVPHTPGQLAEFIGETNPGPEGLDIMGNYDTWVYIELPPAAPTLLTATINGGDVDLVWTDNATDELGYRVERSATTQNNWVVLEAALAASSTGYTDVLPAYGTYDYRVASYKTQAGNISYSNVETITVTASGSTVFDVWSAYFTGAQNHSMFKFNESGDTLINYGVAEDGVYVNNPTRQLAGIEVSDDIYAFQSTYNATHASAPHAKADITQIDLSGDWAIFHCFNLTSFPSDGRIFSISNKTGFGDRIEIRNNGSTNMRVYLRNGATFDYLTTTPLADGNNHYLLMAYDSAANNVKIWLDGTLVFDESTIDFIPTISCIAFGINYINGSIANSTTCKHDSFMFALDKYPDETFRTNLFNSVELAV